MGIKDFFRTGYSNLITGRNFNMQKLDELLNSSNFYDGFDIMKIYQMFASKKGLSEYPKDEILNYLKTDEFKNLVSIQITPKMLLKYLETNKNDISKKLKLAFFLSVYTNYENKYEDIIKEIYSEEHKDGKDYAGVVESIIEREGTSNSINILKGYFKYGNPSKEKVLPLLKKIGVCYDMNIPNSQNIEAMYELIEQTKKFDLKSEDFLKIFSSNGLIKNEILFEYFVESYNVPSKLAIQVICMISSELKQKELISKYKEFGITKEDLINAAITNDAFQEYGMISLLKNRVIEKFVLENPEEIELTATQAKQIIHNYRNKICDELDGIGRSSEYITSKVRECSIMPFEYAKRLKEIDENRYKEFINEYFGNVNYDKDGNFILPQELIESFTNIETEEQLKWIDENLKAVIQSWPQIEEQIHFQKANNQLVGGLNVRTNYSSIFSAYAAICRIAPTTEAATEFELTKGSELVGLDTKFTTSVETSVQRAHELADKMNNSGTKKHFSDFSIISEDKSKPSLKVLHPQDKSAILLGYSTNCCFRPNGNADGAAKNKNSLLQYCTTTPYGGILECGYLNENNEFEEITMGTPILTNGNVMMFHSYESNYDQYSRRTENQRLLLQAAQKVIQESDGKIKAVMITDLHKNLPVRNYVEIDRFFKPYTEGDLEPYKNMYHNLSDPDFKHYLIALEVNGKVLTGQELKSWVEKGNDFKTIAKLGESDYEYDFGERIFSEKLKVEQYGIVKKFKDKYDNLKDERALLALIRRKEILNSKQELTSDEEKEMQSIEGELIDIYGEGKVPQIPLNEVEQKISDNSQEILSVFKAEDLNLMVEAYGISEEKMEDIIKEEAIKKAEIVMGARFSKTSSNQKSNSHLKQRNILIGSIKKSNEPKLQPIFEKIIGEKDLTEKDYELLDKFSIDYEKYKTTLNFEKSEATKDAELKTAIVSKAKSYTEEPGFRRGIIIRTLIPEPEQETVHQVIFNRLVDVVSTGIKNSLDANSAQDLSEEQIKENEKKAEEITLEFSKELHSLAYGEKNENIKDVSTYLNTGYSVNLLGIFEDITQDKEEIIQDARKRDFRTVMSQVSVGIKRMDNINRVMASIDKDFKGEGSYETVNFGKNWYISLNESENNVFMSEEIAESDKAKMQEVMKNLIEKENRQSLKSEYTRLFGEYTPSFLPLENAVSESRIEAAAVDKYNFSSEFSEKTTEQDKKHEK